MGIKAIKKYLFSKYQRVFVDCSLEEDIPFTDDEDFIFEIFDSADKELFKITLKERDFISDLNMEEALDRLENDFSLYVIKNKNKNKIIGYEWCVIKEFYIGYLEAKIILKSNEIYSIFHYVHKDFRGLGLANRLHAFMYNDLRRKNFIRIIGDVSVENKPSIKAISRFKWQVLGKVTHGYLGTINYFINNVPKERLTLEPYFFVFWKKLYAKIKKQLMPRSQTR